MEKTTKQIVVSWVDPNNTENPVQYRKYNDTNKADEFIRRLYDRGIFSCVKKEKIILSDNN